MSSIPRIFLASIQCHPRAANFCLESYLRAATSKASSILPLGGLPRVIITEIQVLFRLLSTKQNLSTRYELDKLGNFFGNNIAMDREKKDLSSICLTQSAKSHVRGSRHKLTGIKGVACCQGLLLADPSTNLP